MLKRLICGLAGLGLFLVAQMAIAAPSIYLLYFAASDCPACRAWEVNEFPILKASPYWADVTFVKIAKTIKAPLPGKFWWPKEIKHLYEPVAEKFAQSRIKKGTPMSALIVDGQVISYGLGTGKLKPDRLLPVIEAAVQGKSVESIGK